MKSAFHFGGKAGDMSIPFDNSGDYDTKISDKRNKIITNRKSVVCPAVESNNLFLVWCFVEQFSDDHSWNEATYWKKLS